MARYIRMAVDALQAELAVTGDVDDPKSAAALYKAGAIRVMLKGGNSSAQQSAAPVTESDHRAIPESCANSTEPHANVVRPFVEEAMGGGEGMLSARLHQRR